MKAKRDTRFFGQYSRSAIRVGLHKPCPPSAFDANLTIGSRYIYELYYDKEAISKKLYDWLLKNGYADGNLIAKWKKQGYEKVRYSITGRPNSWKLIYVLHSSAAFVVFRPRRRTSTRLAYAGYPRSSSKKIRQLSA